MDNNQDFFELMRDANQVEIDRKYNARQCVFYLVMGVFSIVFELLTLQILSINDFTSIVIAVLFISLVVSFVFFTISVFQKNNYHFKIRRKTIGDISIQGLMVCIYCTCDRCNDRKQNQQ